MGFPVYYSELLLSTVLIHLVYLLGFFCRLISLAFHAVGLADLLDSDVSSPPWTNLRRMPEFKSASAMLIQEILPVVRFEEMQGTLGHDLPESCAVCLYEFEGAEEIRRLSNCRHIFHRSCLDRWVEHDQRTCPLCRTPLIPDEMQEDFSDKFWAAAGIPDSSYADAYDDDYDYGYTATSYLPLLSPPPPS